MNPTVGQPLEFNRHHWRRPVYRGDAGAEWVREHGFGAEDWNFDLSQAVDGFVYGYGQGEVGKERRHVADRFDVLFYVRDSNGIFRAAGLYLDAEYLDADAAVEAWALLEARGIVQRRSAELRAAFGQHTSAAARAVEVFEAERPVRWKVAERNIVVFDDLPAFTPLRDTDYRHRNAYDWSEHPWRALDLVPERPLETSEGRLVLRVHLERERSSAFRAAVVARRQALQGSLRCEACGFDFVRVYGPALEGFIEAHHTVPLATLTTATIVAADQIALLCANCHRAAHRTGHHTAASLRELMKPFMKSNRCDMWAVRLERT